MGEGHPSLAAHKSPLVNVLPVKSAKAQSDKSVTVLDHWATTPYAHLRPQSRPSDDLHHRACPWIPRKNLSLRDSPKSNSSRRSMFKGGVSPDPTAEISFSPTFDRRTFARQNQPPQNDSRLKSNTRKATFEQGSWKVGGRYQQKQFDHGLGYSMKAARYDKRDHAAVFHFDKRSPRHCSPDETLVVTIETSVLHHESPQSGIFQHLPKATTHSKPALPQGPKSH